MRMAGSGWWGRDEGILARFLAWLRRGMADVADLCADCGAVGSGGGHAAKEQVVLDKLCAFFERFFGLAEESRARLASLVPFIVLTGCGGKTYAMGIYRNRILPRIMNAAMSSDENCEIRA